VNDRAGWFDTGRASAPGATLFAAGLAVATALMFWLGWRATRAWQLSTRDAAETRANEMAALLSVALERDMKGGQVSVLVPFNEALVNSPPYELADRFAQGFARFPYLESFYVWTERGGAGGTTYVFNRADRKPRWDRAPDPEEPFPVVFRRDPSSLEPVVGRVRTSARTGTHFAVHDLVIEGVRYQSVAQLMYEGEGDLARLAASVGFLVDLDWVRQHYFGDFMRQIQAIMADPTLSLEIRDNEGTAVASVGDSVSGAPEHTRSFAFAFVDPALLPDLPRASRPRAWTARVRVGDEASITAASQAATRTLLILALGAFATIVGLGFTVRAARAAADLTATQAEFVSAVSHEMKTPLSLVKLASDTLANKRYSTPEAVGDYGRMINVEAQHLTRLIDNVLCYARINAGTSAYDLEPLDLADLAQESLDRIQPRLAERGVELELQVPSDPVVVSGDHLMLRLVFDNLVENALTHAGDGKWLGVRISIEGPHAVMEVADRGEGIPAEELPKVFEKFYRRKGTRQRGTGLGLAIVRRIVEDHGGRVDLESRIGSGTVARVVLTLAEARA
jgi:signal transduction histidine kinase